MNCVRWSASGQYLATASDDNLVILWALSPGRARRVFGGDPSVSHSESWGRAMTFKGHTMDVLDLAWAPGGDRLASCGIDRQVCVWDVAGAFSGGHRLVTKPFRCLSGHTNWVKGLAWDPVGSFLVSASEDATVRVWRTSDWQLQVRRPPVKRERLATAPSSGS